MAFAASIPTSTVATRGAASHARRARVAGCRRRAAGWRERRPLAPAAFGGVRDRDSGEGGGGRARVPSAAARGQGARSPWARRRGRGPPRARGPVALGDDLLVPRPPESGRVRHLSRVETDPDVRKPRKPRARGRGARGRGETRRRPSPRGGVRHRTPPSAACERAGIGRLGGGAMAARLGDEPRQVVGQRRQGRREWWGPERAGRPDGHHARLSRASARPSRRDDPVGAFTVKEGLFVLVPIWLVVCRRGRMLLCPTTRSRRPAPASAA